MLSLPPPMATVFSAVGSLPRSILLVLVLILISPVLASEYDDKVYYVYGLMPLVFVILVIVTVCVTIVGTCFLLNPENYHWKWTSFFSAASTEVNVSYVLNLSLLCEDKDVRLLSNQLLLWIHFDILSWYWNTLWCCWFFWDPTCSSDESTETSNAIRDLCMGEL